MFPFGSFDTPGTPGGASIVEWNKFWSFRSLWEGRAFFSPRVRLNCSCQVVGHNRSSSLRYDQDFFVPIFCSHRYFMLTFLSGLSFDVCSYIPTGLHSKVNYVNLKIKCISSVTFTIPKLKCFLLNCKWFCLCQTYKMLQISKLNDNALSGPLKPICRTCKQIKLNL